MLKTNLAAFFFIASAFTVSQTALADGGLFVEPGVTYQQYNSSISYPAPFSNSTGKVSGLGLMGRVGFHINDVFFVAADARFARPTFKDSSNNLNSTANQYDLGPVVGVQTPVVGLRVWATYILTSQLDPAESNSFDYKFNNGTGYRIGAGFHVGIVSLNLEYQKIDYSNTTVEKMGPISGNTDSIKFNGDGWIASVSFPLEM
jgi:hypothetical protein